MLTVLELITKTTAFFEKKGIDSPRYNAEMLLAFVLNCRRLDLYLMFDKPIGAAEVDKYRELIKQRAESCPLQYLLGSVDFYNVSLKVKPGALIPRPETELLVEKCIEAARQMRRCRILDIGTGSGNIAIALAYNLPDIELISVDISAEALTIAAENAGLNNIAERVKFEQRDVFAGDFCALGNFNIIVSNPPYVSAEEYDSLQPEIVKYEPRIAVTDSDNGYRFYQRISTIASEMLSPGGCLLFEMAKDQHEKIAALMIENNFNEIELFRDLQGIERVIKGKLK